jgi:hypothetical protein
MMHLRIDLERRFRDELTEFEEARRMPYVTSIERLAEARMVLRQLSEICGTLPVDVRDRVHAMPSEQLELLGSDLLRFHSITDLQHWLDQHAAPDE